jgi:hypothetical protein
LCIDCTSTGVFRLPYCAELGGIFADALYTLFTQSERLFQGTKETAAS